MRAWRPALRRPRAGGIRLSKHPATRVRHNSTFTEENPSRYCPGGYHPVHIGDEFKNGTYKVVNKLGYGVYSTVWLAHNVWTKRHVALKVLTADTFGGEKSTFELDILRHMASRSKQVPNTNGPHHVLGLLDEFRHEGPNGQHVCLVFKAMGSDLSHYRRLFPQLRIPLPIAKKMSKQFLDALVFLHDTCRVIHCDIKPQNILVETTEINDMFDHAPSEAFMPQATAPRSSQDYYMRSEQISSAEEDLSTSADVSVRLADFGTSSYFDKHLSEWIQPPMLRAPEVILGARWDHKVDIWNLGLIIWELVQGQLVFDGQATAVAEYSSEAYLAQMRAILGPFPQTLIARSKFGSKYFNQHGQLAGGNMFAPRSLETLNRCTNISKDDKADFEDFIGSMLLLEPQQRPDARELLKARWLADINL